MGRRTARGLVIAAVAVLLFGLVAEPAHAGGRGAAGQPGATFPPELSSYADEDMDLFDRLRQRVELNPFNLVATILFFLAILHTFMAGKLRALSHRLEHGHKQKVKEGRKGLRSESKGASLLHFLSDIEVVFGLWAIPLLISIDIFFDWSTVKHYITESVNYTEPMFVVVIMVLASTRPILKLSEAAMRKIAELFGGSLTAWWLTILTIGPTLGSYITEPAAMTICALLLVRKFYRLGLSTRLKYATLGLLFVNVSVGGTLTHFAAPPVLMVSAPWGWGMGHMFFNFGWKAILGIAIANGTYWLVFRKEFASLRDKFARRTLREAVLTEHLPRESIERAIDKILAGIREETGDYRNELSALVDDLTEKIREPLERQCVESIVASGVDEDLAREVFQKRFEEIKLYRIQRGLPQLLPKEKRATFVDPNWDQREDPVPAWVTVIHVAFMAWTIANAHYPALFIPGLLFFIGFAQVTTDYQNRINLKSPLLVGFFLGGLVTHGGVQGWWIEPVLGGLTEIPLAISSTVLTAFNDNAAITYLSTLVPGFTDSLKYAVVAGAVTGGGLTVIANAPNPAGQSILNEYFDDGISPAGLFKAAVVPTIILFLCFMLLR